MTVADNIYDLEAAKALKAEKRRRAEEAKRKNGHGPGDWQSGLTFNSQGKPHGTLGNAMLALRNAQELAFGFAFNDFSSRVEVRRPLPGIFTTQVTPRELGDNDISSITGWLNQSLEMPVQSRVTAEAVMAVAGDCHFHPVRDYLGALVWDRVPRLDLWLHDHLGAQDTVLHRAFASRWLIGMVARVFQPGCQFDTAIIFESRQGLGKSSALRVLGGDWFTDHLPDLTNKDALQQLQGVWIIEIAELDSLRRAETHRIKSFISARVDRFRPPYGHTPRDFPRQCGFGGTVNPGSNGYLRDETGARRFWTVACGKEWESGQKADIASLATVRDQLWAEAVTRYQAGERWYLDTTELESAQAAAAEDRMEDDPRERKIAALIQGHSSVHMDEILGENGLKIPVEKWNHALRTEIGFVLSSMKWERKQVRLTSGQREYRYFPP
jgi:predicted P-loop ATPase